MPSSPPPPPPATENTDSAGVPDETHRFPCEQCGADYRFDPQSGTLTCSHCGHTEEINGGPWRGGALRELDFRAALDRQLPEADMETTRVSKCPNCAAEVEFDPTTHARECPFCATPVVTDTGESRHIKPKGVLPFSIDERAGHKAMTDWLGRLWFAPNGLKEYARKGRRMEGIYVPYWTYDADTRSSYSGQRGTVYYVTETVMVDGKPQAKQVAKVRWRPVSGRVKRFFDDVLVLASKSLPKRYTDALEPWDLSALEPYQPQYLAGFRAEAYAISLQDGFGEARTRMDRVIERDVRFDIGGDRQRISHIDTQVSDVTFKHILLPVWLAAYKYRGKTYRFVVNGQSGRVQGERPYSAWKIAGAVAVLAVLIAAAIYIGNQQ
ncbi:TFIIB-type zinc finger domain-containing protein [Phaeobacter gallaeciensis]|uniref:TFIIB-type zinc finger domain-containing protein n=1 Tax=Phaeobacter gallaeciensis TaxID=60890 RepID=UPI00237EF529|nr:TFIIB-type zinc finger domain-containing protein [Phaeobacter gallaeciensis]MDE4191102.1 TFIIB-type zinc finger domain-containing protein [Phaeobacter gallaeciensis]MDE4199568.1 TFIIB-type zinc finger domain-containing protein [Phaeobacter gallaeciensis]MDE4216225.1 TFIIB-type zinc finger domain-containing protein [Phaeobacter gallaeciensis]MDE4232776.1 TFIIB-type zinc finger domain-containing protein [Phaeobacter gallaeciensis]MDE4245216.1 TFIIB-type zinc finger domain-containing protein [